MQAPPRIVVLDGHALNPGDLDWSELSALGECTVYERTGPDDLLQRAAGAQVLLTNKTRLDGDAMAALGALKYIGILATGHDVVDLEVASQRQVLVTNVPAYSTASVAQLTFALILELTSQVAHHDGLVRQGEWGRRGEFSFFDRPLRELAGLSLGIVGLGRIGSAVAAIGHAFGMEVLVHSTRAELPAGPPMRRLALDALFTQADVVSLHCPLSPSTEGMVDRRLLAQMKPGALLINTARGGLVQQEALVEALVEGRLAGAGLDVLPQEPPPHDSPLFTAPNCVLTPHMAWATTASRRRLMRVAADNLRAYLAGSPQNALSRGVGLWSAAFLRASRHSALCRNH